MGVIQGTELCKHKYLSCGSVVPWRRRRRSRRAGRVPGTIGRRGRKAETAPTARQSVPAWVRVPRPGRRRAAGAPSPAAPSRASAEAAVTAGAWRVCAYMGCVRSVAVAVAAAVVVVVGWWELGSRWG